MTDALKLLLDFVMTHVSVGAWLAMAAVALVSAGWRWSKYLDRREIEYYKRKIEQIDAEHAQDITRIEEQAKAGKLLDGDFPSIGDLEIREVPVGPTALKRYSDFNIALTKAPPANFWDFSKTTLKEVFSEWFGSSLSTDPHLSEGYGLIGGDEEELPCLLWRGTRGVIVENNTVMKRMYPFVIVRSVPHSKGIDRTTEELFDFIHWLQMWDKAVPNSRFEIIKMHRTRQRAYLRGYYTFNNLQITESVTKSARTYAEYFLMRQIFVLNSSGYTTIISTGLPNRELVTDEYYEQLKEWWASLVLVN